MADYLVIKGKDRATIEIEQETKVVFPFTFNVVAVKATSGSVTVSLSAGAQSGDDGTDTIAEGDSTVFSQLTAKEIYISGSGTVKVWAGVRPEFCPFSKGGKGGGGSGGDNTHYKGTTTTAISNGSTTNPITIDGESYTAVFGDIVVYNYTEFVFDGTVWSEFGRPFDTTPTSGSANAVTSDGIKTALDTKQNTMQYTTMPTITAAMLGQIAQYVGETTNDYVKGYFYIASSDGEAEPTYSWVSMVDSTPTSGSKNAVTSDGIYQKTPLARGGTGTSAVSGGASVGNSGYSFAFGSNASATANFSTAIGNGAKSSQAYCTAIGRGVVANVASQSAFGKFNRPKNNTIFEVGCGYDNNHRENILEATATSVNINGDIQRDGVGIDDYTTTERKIGKWIDGSDLYQRTFEVTGLVNRQWNDNVLGTSGIDIVDAQGWIDWTYNSEPNCRTPLNYYGNSNDYVGTQIIYNDLTIMPNRNNVQIAEAVITIKYTKPSAQSNLMQTAPTEEISETPTTVEEGDMR